MQNRYRSLITVIIATTAEKKRKAQIVAALNSIAEQDIGTVKISVIVNGVIFDKSLVSLIKAFPHVDYHYLEQGDYPEALAFARKKVATPFFTFLDDDDLLTRSSLSLRLAPMLEDNKISVCVGNGVRQKSDQITKVFNNVNVLTEKPLESLAQAKGNWLASCAGLYRTAHINEEYFCDYARYAEWTYLAFKIAAHKKVKFIDSTCYKINYTEGSLSSSKGYILGHVKALDKTLQLSIPKDIRRVLKLKRAKTLHDLSDHFLKKNNKFKAFKYHFLSIFSPHGWQYLSYTRHLIFNSNEPKSQHLKI